MKNQMTPRERMNAFSEGEPLDRVLTVPDMGVTMIHVLGIKAGDYYHSAELMAQLEVELFKQLNHDAVSISTSLRGVAEAMGATVGYPDDNISYLIKPAISTLDEIYRLKPVDPLRDGNLPTLLKAIELTYASLNNQVDVGAAMSGPFSVAASIIGTEQLLKWMVKHPKELHHVMSVVAESNDNYIKEVAKRGVGIGFADPVSSMSLISAKHFREFSLPYLKQNIETVTKHTGSKPGIHICGKSRAIWLDVVDAGISNFSIDNIEDIEDAKNIMGDHVTITGNVPPVDVILFGTQEEINKSVQSCIKKGHDSKKGYILSTGCQIPMYTPIEKVKQFMKAADQFGQYRDLDIKN